MCNRFSYNLATILVRDKAVVAVNLKHSPDKCKVYIARNYAWHIHDLEYVVKIKRVLTDVSKVAPLTIEETHKRKVSFHFNGLLLYQAQK